LGHRLEEAVWIEGLLRRIGGSGAQSARRGHHRLRQGHS
jgi:hypothetical protein